MRQALLVIDAQKELIDGYKEEKSVFNKEKLLSNINGVIKKALETNSEDDLFQPIHNHFR
ncbi:hypothetical protein [Thermoflavimicrobium daqui]|uniref:Isochorismatase family protein n=1 Tax=Thermoflavimicrobium daqui TaxID=2137476 RepID=A0A364K3N2_9BACL|nr:hypothetical protein DL897_12275 [Thermoflavimicrobium daqui]